MMFVLANIEQVELSDGSTLPSALEKSWMCSDINEVKSFFKDFIKENCTYTLSSSVPIKFRQINWYTLDEGIFFDENSLKEMSELKTYIHIDFNKFNTIADEVYKEMTDYFSNINAKLQEQYRDYLDDPIKNNQIEFAKSIITKYPESFKEVVV